MTATASCMKGNSKLLPRSGVKKKGYASINLFSLAVLFRDVAAGIYHSKHKVLDWSCFKHMADTRVDNDGHVFG